MLDPYKEKKQSIEKNKKSDINKVLSAISSFSETKSISGDGGWPIVKDKDLITLSDIFRRIIKLKFGKDSDGDIPVEFRLIDRTRYNSMGFFQLPYSHYAESVEDMMKITHLAEVNLNMAHATFDNMWRLLQFEVKAEKEKSKGEEKGA